MKTRILFLLKSQTDVDNFKTTLVPMYDGWELTFYTNSDEAFKSIEISSCDVVLSDYRPHEKNGSDFFAILSKLYPSVYRVLFFNETLKEKAIRSSNIAHRLLKANCGNDEIVKTINDLKKLKKYNMSGELVSLINGFGPIPVLPEIYLRMEKELNKLEISVHRISEIITLDPLMVAKILHIANSSFCIFSKGINNLVNAINMLGTNIIKTLVLYIKVFTINNVTLDTQAMLKRLRSHSIETAKIAKSIAESDSKNRELIEYAYIAGLIHDIGKIVLLQYSDKNNQNKYTHEVFGNNCIEAEKRIFGVTHVETAVYLLGLWGFPDKIVDAISNHHQIETLSDENITLSNVVFIANAICNNDLPAIEIINNKFGEERVSSWKKQLESVPS